MKSFGLTLILVVLAAVKTFAQTQADLIPQDAQDVFVRDHFIRYSTSSSLTSIIEFNRRVFTQHGWAVGEPQESFWPGELWTAMRCEKDGRTVGVQVLWTGGPHRVVGFVLDLGR